MNGIRTLSVLEMIILSETIAPYYAKHFMMRNEFINLSDKLQGVVTKQEFERFRESINDKLDKKLEKFDDKIDIKFEKISDKLDSNLKWTIGTMITLIGIALATIKLIMI